MALILNCKGIMDNQQHFRLSSSNFRLIFPAILAIGLFIFSIYFFIIPAFKGSIMDRKKEMIQQLTNSAWSILDKYNREIKEKGYELGQAQDLAKKDIRFLRYGSENKDYFWIIDTQPKMIMHPYRSQLEGHDLSNEMDPSGKKLFVAMVRLCELEQHGFIEYMWQWKDNPSRVVPKLSYVKKFQAWGWIIGTGIYTEDVDNEISGLTKNLILVSIIIILFILVILLYIMNNSLKIEKKRKIAENKLIQSEIKYRSLVEATTQGILIVHGSDIVYSNKFIQEFLGYSENEFIELNLSSIFPPQSGGKDYEYEKFQNHIKNNLSSVSYECCFIKKNLETVDVLLFVSSISFGKDRGNAIVVNDISEDKKIKEELGQSREQYRNLTDNLKIGVFRSTLGRKGRIVEANPAVVNILGFSSKTDLFKVTIVEFFKSRKKWLKLSKNLIESGFLKNKVIQIKKPDDSVATLMLSLVLVKDPQGLNKFCDGIIEDITERFRTEEDKDKLMVELKTAQFIFDESLNDYLGEIIYCNLDTPIEQAVALMTRTNQDIIFIKNNLSDDHYLNEYIGVLTSRDLRDRVLNGKISQKTQVMKIMSSPVVTISQSSSIFESLILMREKKIGHLAVTDYSGKIRGAIHRDLLFNIQNNSASLLISEIQRTDFVQEIFPKHTRVPSLVRVLTDSGANSKIICRKISAIADSILKKLIQFAIAEIGRPPLRFSFMSLGSEGREEQTLLTDQDNAIIYEDTGDKKLAEEAEQYFLKFGKMICTWMNKCGYSFCPGEIMAMNPKWNKPISSWKKYFEKWINNSSPQDLMEINVFFDFRTVYGEKNLTSDLRNFIHAQITSQPSFLQYIARNALLYKPPIGFFGKILLESGGEKPSTFNIKDSIHLLVNFARIYSLKHNVSETNTLNRLYHLLKANVITDSTYREMVEVYDYLMKSRFRHQVKSIRMNLKPDNNIDPRELTEVEHHMLKYIFSQINNFQKKLSFDFTGNA
jgi:PAS domain S-box-containing protein